MVTLFRLLGVSAKHLREEVSTTVSQKDTTGSATFTSTSAYSSLRSYKHKPANLILWSADSLPSQLHHDVSWSAEYAMASK